MLHDKPGRTNPTIGKIGQYSKYTTLVAMTLGSILTCKQPENQQITPQEISQKQQKRISYDTIYHTIYDTIIDTIPVSQPDMILNTADLYIDNDERGKHCRDRVEKVYENNGYSVIDPRKNTLKDVEIIYLNKETGRVNPKDVTNDLYHPLPAQDAPKLIKKGDRIYVHNRNDIDPHGNHSGIFIWRADTTQTIIQLACLPNMDKEAPRVNTYDITKEPITFIGRARKRATQERIITRIEPKIIEQNG